jgi:Ring finger domain
MGTLCQCVFRFCCDPAEDSSERRRLQTFETANNHPRMVIVRDEQPPPPAADQNPTYPPHIYGILEMFQQLRNRWQSTEQFYDIMRQQSEDDDGDNFTTDFLRKPPPSPHQATSFSSTLDIPCIHSDEIVFPGSALQKKMAEKLTCARLKDDDIECVVCMEPFSYENPRMPTLCGCGENKTLFHLPCLYQWVEQSSDCPNCRQKITWEEFSS